MGWSWWLGCVAGVAPRWVLRYSVLFGSRARGYGGSHSDYDITVKAGRRPSLRDQGLIYAELGECVERQLDMLVINDWDPVATW